MKIAMIGQKGIPAISGGVEKHVEEIGKRLVSQGHELTVYCRSTYSDYQPLTYEGIKLKYIKTIANKNLEAIVYTLKATLDALAQDYDILHYHALGPASLTFLPWIFRKKVIVTVHGLDWQRDKWGKFAKLYLKFGEKASAIFPNRLISVSENLKQYYINKYHKRPENVIFIPNGVNVRPYVEPKEIKFYGLEKNSYILFLARLVPEKGAHYLIEAFQKINTDKKLVIAGGSSYTDEYVDRLKQSVKGNQNIIFTGNVQGRLLEELYCNAYIYVLPSDIEGMPLTLLEAMSYQKCCLVSNIPENTGVIKGEYGISFQKSNINDLTNKISALLNDPQMVDEIGKKAYQEILNNYNWDGLAIQTNEVYKTILGNFK